MTEKKLAGLKENVLRLSIGVSLALCALKLAFGLLTGSMSILASAVDSLMDFLASTVNLISLRKAEKPPDWDHAYGHGKIESLAALFQSIFVGFSAFIVSIIMLRRILHSEVLTRPDVGMGVMLISILTTAFLVQRLREVERKAESLVLEAERLHYSADFATNFGVLAGLALVYLTGLSAWDFLVAFMVVIWVLRLSFKVFWNATDELMDRELPEPMKQQLAQTIQNFHPHIVGFHDLRTHKVGAKRFIDFHIEIRGDLSFKEAHEITEDLIEDLRRKIPGADITVHMDPEGATR